MFGFCLSCNVEYNDRFNMLGNRPTDQFTMMGQQLHPTTTTTTTTSTATTSGHNHTTSQYRKQQRPRNLCSAWPSFAQRLFPVYYFHNADTQRVKGKCCGGMSGVQAGRWGGGLLGTPTRCRCVIYIMSLSTTASLATRHPLLLSGTRQPPISASILESLV